MARGKRKSRRQFVVKIPENGVVIMGKHSSGHNDSSNLKHGVRHTDKKVRGGIVGFDVAITDDKAGGTNWIRSLEEYNAKLGVKGFKKMFRATGNEKVMEDAMTDLFIRVVNPDKIEEGASQDEIRKEVVAELVKRATDSEDPLMVLHFENGDSGSSGGYSQRAEYLLRKIPFFNILYRDINLCFDIKQTWFRASLEGTHHMHNDSFTRGATHRIILSINCYGKEMIFSH